MKVLLATDGSRYAMGAARLLSHLSFVDELRLTVLSVTPDPISANPENFQLWVPEWDMEQIAALNRHHREIKTMFSDRCDEVTTLHRRGNVGRAILDAAEETHADLIVLGAVGHSMIGRMLLGSVSDNIATHAKCSVLIVRPPADDPDGEPRMNRISLAYDGSNASSEAINEMAQVAWDQGTRVSLISIALRQDLLVGQGLSSAAIAEDDERLEKMRQSCDSAIAQLPKTLPNAQSHVVQSPHVGEAIVKAAAEDRSDLIVLGDGGHTVLFDWIVGSTTKYVLRHAHCSVWISRHHRKSTAPGEQRSASRAASNE